MEKRIKVEKLKRCFMSKGFSIENKFSETEEITKIVMIKKKLLDTEYPKLRIIKSEQ